MVRISIPLANIPKGEEGSSISSPREFPSIFNGYIYNDGQEKCIVRRPGVADFGSTFSAPVVFHPYIDTNGRQYAINGNSKRIVLGGTELGAASACTDMFTGNGVTWAEDDDWIYIHGGNGDTFAHTDYVLPKTNIGGVIVDTVQSITDAQHPIVAGLFSPPGVVALDGYFFVIGGDGIYNSDLGDPTAWQAANVITAALEPDALYYLAKHKNHVVAFGSTSIEFFQNVGNPVGSPLQRRNDIFFKVGIVSHGLKALDGGGAAIPQHAGDPVAAFKSMVAQYGDVLYFLGRPEGGAMGVYMLKDFQLTRISTPAIDRLLLADGMKNTGNDGSVIRGIVTFNNKDFLVVDPNYFSSDDGLDPLVYDIAENVWYQWDVDYSRGVYKNLVADGGTILRTVSGGTDDGVAISGPTIFTPKVNNIPGLKENVHNLRKFNNSLSLRAGRRGVATTINVSYTDDDFQTFSTARSLDLEDPAAKLTRLGSFYERSYKLSYSDDGSAASPRLYELILDVDIGTK